MQWLSIFLNNNPNITILDIINLLLVIINLILIIFFFHKNTKLDKKKYKLATENSWKKDVLLPMCIEQIRSWEKEMSDIFKNKTDYEMFFESFTIMQGKMTSIFELLKNVDDNINKYTKAFEEFEDKISKAYIDNQKYDINSYINTIVIYIYTHEKGMANLK